jgi:hypothetical protein
MGTYSDQPTNAKMTSSHAGLCKHALFESCYITQAGLEFVILLPWLPSKEAGITSVHHHTQCKHSLMLRKSPHI